MTSLLLFYMINPFLGGYKVYYKRKKIKGKQVGHMELRRLKNRRTKKKHGAE